MGLFYFSAVEKLPAAAARFKAHKPGFPFLCENAGCEHNRSAIRYVPDSNEKTPDVLLCPICGNSLVNQELLRIFKDFGKEFRKIPDRTPEKYHASLRGLSLYRRIYLSKDSSKLPLKEIPPLDVLIEIAPVIFDVPRIFVIMDFVESNNLVNYQPDVVKRHLDIMPGLKKLIDRLPSRVKIRLSDLKAECYTALPGIDLGAVAYIWYQFGYIEQELINNFIYISKL